MTKKMSITQSAFTEQWPSANDFESAKQLVNEVELETIFLSLQFHISVPDSEKERYVNNYRKWLVLRMFYDRKSTPPNREIDAMWHEHIIHTDKYIKDCERIYGGYMHHNPSNNPKNPNAQQINNDLGVAAVKQYWLRHYGEEIDYSSGSECD